MDVLSPARDLQTLLGIVNLFLTNDMADVVIGSGTTNSCLMPLICWIWSVIWGTSCLNTVGTEKGQVITQKGQVLAIEPSIVGAATTEPRKSSIELFYLDSWSFQHLLQDET